MSVAPQQRRIFGIKLGVDPKILVGALLVLALGLFIYNSRNESDSDTSHTTTGPAPVAEAPEQGTPLRATQVQAAQGRTTSRRNRQAAVDRGTLGIHPVDATRGDIDPRLRLDVLESLNKISAGAPGRSLFEIGAAPVAPSMAAIQKLNQRIVPTNAPATNPAIAVAQTPQVNIPFKYYGFARSAEGARHSRGLFLDGDNVVVAAEGELIANRYLVAELSAASARVEDTQMKQGQTLAVTPEAQEQ